MKKTIHINQHKIKSNRKHDMCEPVITCKTYKDNQYGHEVEILDTQGNVVAKVIYRPEKPLSCGAHVWLETYNEVNIINK